MTKMMEIGYKDIHQTRTSLPNGKALRRLDFREGAVSEKSRRRSNIFDSSDYAYRVRRIG